MDDIFFLREGELNLLVNLSVASVFLEDFGIPVSCCHRFTGDRGRRGGHPVFSRKLWSLLQEQRIHATNQGSIRVYKLSRSLAAQIVKTLEWNRYTTVGWAMYDFIVMTWNLFSDDPGDHYLRDKGHELLLRRAPVQQREGEVYKHKFSLLVSYLLQRDKQGIYYVVQNVHTTVRHPRNAPISQLLARMYMHDKCYSEAYTYAKMAVEADPGNSFYMDTKGRVIIEQMRQYLTSFARRYQPHAAESFLNLLDEGLDTFSRCQILSKSEESKFVNLAGYYGELKLIFTFLEILPAFFGSPPGQLQKYLLTNKHVLGVHGVFVDRRLKIQGLQDHIEASLGYLTDVRTFCERGLRFQIRELNSFRQDRSKFFPVLVDENEGKEEDDDGDHDHDNDGDHEDDYGGDDDGDEEDDNGDDENMDLMCRRRRLQVRSMTEPTLSAVFQLDEHTLTRIRGLLGENCKKTTFDRKLLVWIEFALASVDARSVHRDEAERQVQELLTESSDSLNGPFFNMLLAWPQQGAGTERYLKAAEDLKSMWVRLYKIDAGSVTPKAKPATVFFLSKGRDIGAFIHISCLPAFTSEEPLEHQDITFWGSDVVEEKLARLEGTLRDTETILYSVSTSETIPIKLSIPWPQKTQEEKVSFYVGFSFAEPMAYHVRVTDDDV